MISNRYSVGEVVGAGAFATVFRALDPRLDSPVAIKVLAENWSADPAVCERFGREAMLLRRVRSNDRSAPLVEVFDIDQTPDGRPFFVMSFADRGTLAARFVAGHPWPTAAVRDVIVTLGNGLHALHTAGIVHRDIKPSNLLYVSQPDAAGGEHLLIGDLGLAKDLLTATTELTVAGGTPGYMAPEQGAASVAVTPAADVFSATVVVCELLSGQRGREGIADLSRPMQSVVRRGTAVEPGRRHESIRAWSDAMLAALDGGAAVATTPAPASRRTRWVSAAAVVLVACILAVAGLATLLGGEPDVSIIGPETAVVGETVFFRADVPVGGFGVWTVGENRVADQDLQLTPQSAGIVLVLLDVTDADGVTTRVEHRVVISDG